MDAGLDDGYDRREGLLGRPRYAWVMVIYNKIVIEHANNIPWCLFELRFPELLIVLLIIFFCCIILHEVKRIMEENRYWDSH